MIKYWLCLSSFLFAINLSGTDIEIKLVQQSNLMVNPGSINNFSIVILNKGANPTALLPEVDAPEGWKVIMDPSTIQLPAGAKKIKLLSFIIPANTLAEDYDISYRLKNSRQLTEAYTQKFACQVTSTDQLAVIPLSSPTTVMAGAKIASFFLVKNTSNQAQTIALTTSNAKIIGETTIQLLPFSAKEIEVQTATFSELKQEGRLSVHLKATLKGKDFSRTAYQHTRLLPSIDIIQDDTRKLPGYASINYLHRIFSNGKVANGWQGELFLEGALDEKNEKQLIISLRGPNQQENTELTLYDEYYASYATPHFSTTVGDNNFILSPLTEFSRNGRGIKTEGYFGNATLGAFYVQPRFFADLKSEVGAYVQNEFNQKSTISFNYLHKSRIDNKGTASILSILGQFKPLRNTFIEAEVASGNSGESAYLKLQSSYFKKLRFNGNLIYASPNFEGYFQNTLTFFGNLNYQLTKRVNVVAGIFIDDRNAAIDTLFQAAPYTDRRHIGFNMKLGKHSQFQFNLRQNEIEDRLPEKQFFREEYLMTGGFSQSSKGFNLSLTAEYGKSKDYLQTVETNFQNIFRAYAEMTIRLNNFSLRGFGQYNNENSLLLPEQKQFLWGGALSAKIKRQTKILLRYQNDYAVQEYYKNRNTIEFSFLQNIKRNHQFIINARQTIRRNTLSNRDMTISAKYVWNFGIRLEEKAPTGNVYGTIHRKSGESVKGIPVLLNGKTAITDETGQFRFKNMRPGKYPLMLDHTALDLHEILAEEAVPSIDIIANFDQRVDLTLIQSGTISGGIEFKKEAQQSNLTALKTVGNLMLEITNGEIIRRTFTDERGQYKFSDLKPGTWQVKVLKEHINKHLKVAETDFTVTIQEGTLVSLPIVIQKKKRNIQFKHLKTLSDD